MTKPPALLLMALALTSCSTDGSNVSPSAAAAPKETNIDVAERTPPKISKSTAKRLILANRSHLFKDAPSIRDARISEPFTCFSLDADCICAETNARNSYGGYTGMQLIGFRFPNDTSVEPIGVMAEKAREGACGKLSPFPELNGKR